MKHVLLVTGSDYSTEIYDSLEKLKKTGIKFSLLSDGSFVEKVKLFENHLAFDLRKTSETIEYVKSKNLNFDAITQKSSEWLTTLVALLQKEFSLSGTSPKAAFRCRSKLHMREWMQKHDLPSPQFRRVSDFDSLWAAVEQLTPPVVAKPIGGNASYGTFLIQDLSEKDSVKSLYESSIEYLKKMSIDMDVFSFSKEEMSLFGLSEFYDLTTDYLIEKYIDGYKNLSIDTLVHNGEVTPICIAEQTRMKPPFFMQEREIIPADLNSNELKEVLNLNQRAIKAFELEQTAVHLEVILTKSGPVLLELACRIGGDNIHNSTLTTTGIHLLEEQVLIALGEKRRYQFSSTQFSATEYLLPTNLSPDWHEVTEIVFLNDLNNYSVSEYQIVVEPGSKIAPPPISFDFYGYVTCTGETSLLAKESAMAAAQQIKINTRLAYQSTPS